MNSYLQVEIKPMEPILLEQKLIIISKRLYFQEWLYLEFSLEGPMLICKQKKYILLPIKA
ncbi:hypothetical protein [Riemerella anatipestifer]|uniref:hypothetical protein n=1 Tax=Riemerella anatipestifer TaxID=34085 RepID=UPI0021AAE2CF|nr:hypothetical protein [Riemerella anatipestifer]